MGKRPLNTQLPSNPTVRLAEKLNSRFVGRYLTSKDVNISGKPSKLYEFAAQEGDALITVKDGNTYREANVNPGDTVTVFGSKAIDTAMAGAVQGELIEIIFNGEKKLKGGRRFNDYAVNVIEEDAK